MCWKFWRSFVFCLLTLGLPSAVALAQEEEPPADTEEPADIIATDVEVAVEEVEELTEEVEEVIEEIVEEPPPPTPPPVVQSPVDSIPEPETQEESTDKGPIEAEFDHGYVVIDPVARKKDRSTITVDAEYRVRTINIDPVELNSEGVRDISWTEQRFRMDVGWSLLDVGELTLQFDALNGVLFGDNGRFRGDPSSNSGVSLASKRPNLTRWEMGLIPGGDPLDRQSYAPRLVEADLLQLNFLYADVFLPIGLLRVGRQPMNYGMNITAHEGGRVNRWGVSQYSDSVDRFLFATKLDEIYKVARRGSDHEVYKGQDQGLIYALFYDISKQDNIARRSDFLGQLGNNLQLRLKEPGWFGRSWRNFHASATMVYLSNEQFDSSVFAFPMFVESHVDNLFFRVQYNHIRGSSREIAEGFAGLTGREAVDQDLIAHGLHALVDATFGPLTLTMEFNYASGDANPRPTAPITSFSFARDFNVGLLLFEHILAFESARSAAVGIENLSSLDTQSFPLTEVRTEGRFTNAIALFPQAMLEVLTLTNHRVFTRAGVLVAWSATPEGLIDPIITAINDAGGPIEDHYVNFHGGFPERYYGTEIDLQLGYQFRENFFWTLEGAVLFPGAALHDEHGDAVRSFLVENRLEFIF